jgi:homoserine kinase type II
VTILQKKDDAAAQTYADYLESLRTEDFPVAAPIARRDGGYVSRYGSRPALLTHHVEGKQYRQLPVRFLPQVGSMLSRLHSSASLRCNLKPCLRVRLDDIEADESAGDRHFVHWALTWHERVRYVVDLPGPAVPTHGDMFVDNLIVDQQGRVVVIDWEDGARDQSWIDLATALLGLCSPNGFEPRRAQILLDAYGRDALAELDSHVLRDATVYAAIYAAVHRYRRRALRSARVDDDKSYRILESVVESLMHSWDDIPCR